MNNKRKGKKTKQIKKLHACFDDYGFVMRSKTVPDMGSSFISFRFHYPVCRE